MKPLLGRPVDDGRRESQQSGTLGCMDGPGQAHGDRPPGVQISRAAHDALRLAVARFRASEPRRSFPAVLHVGHPGGANADFVDLPERRLDHALRTEVTAALLSRALVNMVRPVAWLTRPGELGAEDADLRWYAAARAAYGEAGVPLAMVVVTRSGWYDPCTGARREWKRLRVRT
jgi:hypothetical protein